MGDQPVTATLKKKHKKVLSVSYQSSSPTSSNQKNQTRNLSKQNSQDSNSPERTEKQDVEIAYAYDPNKAKDDFMRLKNQRLTSTGSEALGQSNQDILSLKSAVLGNQKRKT